MLTVADYLAELEARAAEVPQPEDPVLALRHACELYVDFCLEYPAFLDCALALMQRPAAELRERVSGAVWFRLGRSMSACLGPLERLLAAGAEVGVFAVEDPALRPTGSTRRCSARCISRGSASACARPRPASPKPSRSLRSACAKRAYRMRWRSRG